MCASIEIIKGLELHKKDIEDEILKEKHKFLKLNGWTITPTNFDLHETDGFLYTKDKVTYYRADQAMKYIEIIDSSGRTDSKTTNTPEDLSNYIGEDA
jgi:hypothetical protein